MAPDDVDLALEQLSRVTLRQLEYFRAIAATGSIAAAAEQQHVSRSAVAAALTDLERILECQLCTRHKSHGVELTAAGRQLRDRAVSLLVAAVELEREVRGDGVAGPFTIGCFQSLAPTVLPSLLTRMQQEHPRARPTFVAHTQDVLLDKLWTGEIEFVIGYDLSADRALTTELLYEARMHVIVSGEHPLASKPVIDAQDLRDEHLILLETPPANDDMLGYLHSQGIAPDIRHRTSHFELARSLVGAGLGFSMFMQIPRASVSYDGREVAVRPVSPPPPLKRAEIGWPTGRQLSARARAFVDVALANVELVRPRPLYENAPDAA